MREVLLRGLVYKQNTVKDSKKDRLGCKNEKVEKQTQTFDHLVTIDTCKRGFTQKQCRPTWKCEKFTDQDENTWSTKSTNGSHVKRPNGSSWYQGARPTPYSPLRLFAKHPITPYETLLSVGEGDPPSIILNIIEGVGRFLLSSNISNIHFQHLAFYEIQHPSRFKRN